jgi:hypothetical protein
VIIVASTQLVGAGGIPIRNLKLDESADKVEFFAGMKDGSLSIRMIPIDIREGNIFIQNKTNKTLTVLLPEAFVGIHVLKQFGGGGGFGGQQGGGQGQGGGFGGQGGFGGGMGGAGGLGGGGFGGGGQGFFSIPPHKTAQLAYNGVCLNYGKPDPMPSMTYYPIPIEQYTDNKVLQESLKMYGTGQLDYSVAQAAAWHLTDKLSAQDLADIKTFRIPGDVSTQESVFSESDLQSAAESLTVAQQRAVQRDKTEALKQKNDTPTMGKKARKSVPAK